MYLATAAGVLLAALAAGVGLSELRGGASALDSPKPPGALAAPTPTPPADLIARASKLIGPSSRVDRIEAKLVTWREYTEPGWVAAPDWDAPTWVVVAVGDIEPLGGFGPMARPATTPCAFWAFDEDGKIRSAGGGSLATCQKYFTASLLPAAAAPSCPGTARPGVILRMKTPTRPGPLTIRTARDDAWRRPSLIPGEFLYRYPAESSTYEKLVCTDASAHALGHVLPDEMLAFGARPTVLEETIRDRGWQLWLVDLDAQSASVDGEGAVTVRVERRPGFEVVAIDEFEIFGGPSDGGYVHFDLVGSDGRQVVPSIGFNYPPSR